MLSEEKIMIIVSRFPITPTVPITTNKMFLHPKLVPPSVKMSMPESVESSTFNVLTSGEREDALCVKSIIQ